MMDAAQHLGRTVSGRYRLDGLIASGGMGMLYRATHLRTGRNVALKLLLDPTGTRRFELEARAAAELAHPNVVDVLDMDEDEQGTPYLVLELLEGQSLSAVLSAESCLSAARCVSWLVPVMGALAVAHDRGILHRDIKPSNIFIASSPSGGTPKLLDFGIAKKVSSAQGITRTGMIVGTPSHMSPEQARGAGDLGPTSDVWSMGVVWFQCLTGRLPFEHEEPLVTLTRIVTEQAPPVHSIGEGVPRRLGWTIDRALKRDPAARYRDMRSFARAILAASAADGVELPLAPDPHGLPEWSRWLAEQHAVSTTSSLPAIAPHRDPSEPRTHVESASADVRSSVESTRKAFEPASACAAAEPPAAFDGRDVHPSRRRWPWLLSALVIAAIAATALGRVRTRSTQPAHGTHALDTAPHAAPGGDRARAVVTPPRSPAPQSGVAEPKAAAVDPKPARPSRAPRQASAVAHEPARASDLLDEGDF